MVLVSRDGRRAILSNCKCAWTTVRRSCEMLGCLDRTEEVMRETGYHEGHIPAAVARAALGEQTLLAAFVRNPWERSFALWDFLGRPCGDFGRWCDEDTQTWAFWSEHRPWSVFANGDPSVPGGRSVIDAVFRVEDMGDPSEVERLRLFACGDTADALRDAAQWVYREKTKEQADRLRLEAHEAFRQRPDLVERIARVFRSDIEAGNYAAPRTFCRVFVLVPRLNGDNLSFSRLSRGIECIAKNAGNHDSANRDRTSQDLATDRGLPVPIIHSMLVDAPDGPTSRSLAWRRMAKHAIEDDFAADRDVLVFLEQATEWPDDMLPTLASHVVLGKSFCELVRSRDAKDTPVGFAVCAGDWALSSSGDQAAAEEPFSAGVLRLGLSRWRCGSPPSPPQK